MLAPTIESQKSDIFLRKLCLLLVGARIAGPPTVRPAFGTPAAHLSGRKHFPITKKDPQTKPFAGLSSWCTISGSVQKTVRCTVFSDRSPRGECKPHRGAARARPVGDGAPCASLSIIHNAKKDPQVYRLQVLFPGAPSAGAFRKQCSALFLATGPREANASRTAAQHEPAP